MASGLPRDSAASCVHGSCRRRCCADACVQPLPVIAQVVNGFRSAPPTETDVSNRDWASCEAGAAERRLLLGSATTRGARWAHARRDRSVTAASAECKCRRSSQSSSVATEHRPRNHPDPCVCWMDAPWRLPFAPPNGAAKRQPIRQRAWVPATKQPELRVSASFRRSRSSGARYPTRACSPSRSPRRTASMVAAACMRATSMEVWCSAWPQAARARRSAASKRMVSPAAIFERGGCPACAADPERRGRCLRRRPTLSPETGSESNVQFGKVPRLGHGWSALRPDGVSSCGPGTTPLVATLGRPGGVSSAPPGRRRVVRTTCFACGCAAAGVMSRGSGRRNRCDTTQELTFRWRCSSKSPSC